MTSTSLIKLPFTPFLALFCEECSVEKDEKSCKVCGCHYCNQKTLHEMVVCSECGLFICTECYSKFTNAKLFDITYFNDIVLVSFWFEKKIYSFQ